MRSGLTLLAALLLTGLAFAEDNPWPEFRTPYAGPPRAIGGYSKGCLQGSVPLALNGEGYQVMRPKRRRFFGHPSLVAFVKQLAKKLGTRRETVLLVGDLSQVRGGRSNGGHSSHQTGLDVDIWFWHPPAAIEGRLSRSRRNRMPHKTVVDKAAGRILEPWKGKVKDVLELAALDRRVARIFVNPIIKRELCEAPADQRGWLQKIRPWYGHDDHFHVRLKCPEASDACEAQAPIPAGDGCDALGFWFNEKAQAARRKAQKSYQKNVDEGSGWPELCEPLLAAPNGA